MKKICLDTNAIFDLCYRFYPESYFSNLWQSLQASHSSQQFKFFISEHVERELVYKVTSLGYDKLVLDSFLEQFQIDIAIESSYENLLLDTKNDLIAMVTKPDKLMATIDKLDNDFSSICVAKQIKGSVLTSEQGFNLSLQKVKNIREIKIPDSCKWQQVECFNWVGLFEYLGLSF